jgi:hypothetical protein
MVADLDLFGLRLELGHELVVDLALDVDAAARRAFLPASRKALRITPVVALSMSALFVTIVGFLPPISQMTGFGTFVAKFL